MSKPTFGVIFHPSFPSNTLPDFARKAEAAGFEEVWLWDDCFLPGAISSAAVALSATSTLKLGIGLLPVTVYNPLFAAMEITTLALAFPGRILPGFGHGVADWLTQIGAPPSSLATLEASVQAVRGLLNGESVTAHTAGVNLEQVQMRLKPGFQPPLYVGGIRAKTLQLAGRIGDGSLLTDMSSPDYVRWARTQVEIGMQASGRKKHRMVVYLDCKVGLDGEAARSAARRALAPQLVWADAHLKAAGLLDEVGAFRQGRSLEQIAAQMPDRWLDILGASGTPAQCLASIQRIAAAGADSIVLQPLDGDPGCLDEYIRDLLPLINSASW